MTAYRDFISENTVSYLTQQFPHNTPGWMRAFNGEVARIVEKWRLTPSGHEKTSRFGTIIYAASEIYGDVAVKIVPWYSPRLQSEILCYRLLPYREMCALYDVDDPLGAMLLKYVKQDHEAPRERKEALFSRLFAQRRAADNARGALPPYENVLESVAQNALCQIDTARDAQLNAFLPSIRRARAGMELFQNRQRYIIHGDAHEYNMLASGDECVLIDPLGYAAPFAFEYARYLGTAMKETPMTANEFCALTERLLPPGEDRRDALMAFAIDTTLRACNTFIEGNTREEICFAAGWARRAWEYADALLRA